MARIRSDKPEAYQSETLAEVSLAAERTFKGMATIADDRGRLADKPAQINGELWSMRGNHTKDDLESELAEMVDVGLVCRYAGCDGKRYLHLVTWDRHQKIDRPSKSRLPRCPVHDSASDYCGLHAGPCEDRESSRNPREDSRDSQQGQTGHRPDTDALASADPGASVLPFPAAPGIKLAGASDQEKRKSSRDSREPSMQDLGSRTVDLGSVPPSAGARTARRRAAAGEPAERQRHVGEVVAAFVNGATGAGLHSPPAPLKSRVGRQARELLAEDWPVDFLIESARRLGASEYDDLAKQVRMDDAAARGVTRSRASPAAAGRRGGQADDLSDQKYGPGSTDI